MAARPTSPGSRPTPAMPTSPTSRATARSWAACRRARCWRRAPGRQGRGSAVPDGHEPQALGAALERVLRDLAEAAPVELSVQHAGLEARPFVPRQQAVADPPDAE